jgi:protein transport protein SEC13
MASSDIDTQHADVIHDTQFDYYGRFMATASSDKCVKVFATGEENNGAHVATLTGHDGPVWMVDWAHPSFGVAIASCSYDQKAIVWKGNTEGTTWKPSTIVTAHSASVNAVAFAPAPFGLAVATAGSDGHVFVTACPEGAWRDPAVVSQGNNAPAHAMGAMAVSWAPMPAQGAPTFIASGGADATVKVWEFANGAWTPSHTFHDHSDWVRDVAFSPDAAARHLILASCSQDRTVIIRRAPRDRPSEWETSSPVAFKDTVWRLSWSPCGSMLLVTTADAQAFVLRQGATFGDEWIRAPVSADEPAK